MLMIVFILDVCLKAAGQHSDGHEVKQYGMGQ